MRELVAAAMRRARPDIVIRHAHGTHDALLQALTLAAPAGQPLGTATRAVLFIYEKLSDARSALDSIGATPWPEPDLASGPSGDQLIEDLASELARDQDGLVTAPLRSR